MSDPVRITNPGAESLGYDSDGHEIMAVDIYVNPPRVDVFHGTPPNAIESLDSVIRHAIKKRKVFPTDESVKKLVWLAIQSASQKWTMPLQDWRIAMSRFIIEFGDRLDGHF